MIRIITDSTSSIPARLRAQLGIDTVSLHVHRGNTEYDESTMDLDAFYDDIYEMIDDIPTSSQPSPADMELAFEKAAEAGESVLAVFLSSRMSGTFEAALAAAARVKARIPEAKIAIVDSLTNCLELGWPAMAAARARNAGESLEQCVARVRESLDRTRFVFAPESLRFLEKGGRIGRASALLGNLLKISPVLTVQDGFAATLAKVRTYPRALAEIVRVFQDDIEQCGLANVAVHYIGARKPAEEWAHNVIEPIVGHEVLIAPASPVIGLHVGPAMGLAYECLHAIPGKHAAPGPELVFA